MKIWVIVRNVDILSLLQKTNGFYEELHGAWLVSLMRNTLDT